MASGNQTILKSKSSHLDKFGVDEQIIPMESGMDVDEVSPKKTLKDDASEEGELTDDEVSSVQLPVEFEPLERPSITKPQQTLEPDHEAKNQGGGFVTGVDVFGKEEQARLVERAKRFGLDSSQVNLLSEKQLRKLYYSVGVKEDDDKEFRFDSIRMHGTEAMSTQDVFEYFKDYAPASIEWIDDDSCNVVWLDNLSAIRALLGLSKPIKNLSKVQGVKQPSNNKDDGIKKEEEDDVIMIVDEAETNSAKKAEAMEEELTNDPEAIDALELNMSYPPGKWRKGNTHPNSDGVLLRFCPRKSTTDANAGPRRLPQPVFGMVGLVSKSRKQRIKDGLIVRPKQFVDDVGDDRDFVISSDEDDGRNPWGTLAKSWGHIDRSRQPFPLPSEEDDLFGGPPIPPPLPHMLHHLPPSMPLPPSSILHRVGYRGAVKDLKSRGRVSRSRSRSRSESPTEQPSSRPSVHSRLPVQGKRRRGRRGDKKDSEDSALSGSESDEDNWTRKSKIPRMRMYADEEEEKVKERVKLQARRKLSPGRIPSSSFDVNRRPDLRSRLGHDRSRKTSSFWEDADTEYSRNRQPSSAVSSRSHLSSKKSAPRHKIMSVASSVWTRLSRENNVRVKEESDSGSESEVSSCDSDQSQSTRSEEEDVAVMQSVRNNRKESDDGEDEDEVYERRRAAAASKLGIDLRSKLNRQNVPIRPKSSSTNDTNVSIKPRSPLRIEIDNDEYYRHLEDSED